MSDISSYGLNEDEIMHIFQKCDVNSLLLPLQKNPLKYKSYIKFPGRVDKKNSSAVKTVPKVAYDLYLNFDKEYISILNNKIDYIKKNTVVELSDLIGKIVDLSVFTRVNTKEYEQLFLEILEKDKNFDIIYFLAILKILGYSLSETDVLMVKHQWDILETKYLVQKSEKEYYDSLLKDELFNAKKKYEEILANINKEKDDLAKKISKIEKEYKLKYNQFQIEVEEKEEKYIKEIQLRDSLRKENEEEIRNLNSRIQALIQMNEDLTNKCEVITAQKEILEKDLLDKKNLMYDDIELEWMEKNEEKQRELKVIQNNILKETEIKNALTENLKALQEKIDFYNKALENYLENIDIKLIEQRMQNILKGWMKNSISYENSSIAGSFPYIKNEVIRLGCPICDDYKEFCDMAESNLKAVGVRRDAKGILIEFISAFISNLSPVICGFRSLEIVKAIISAWYGEEPMVIEIPTGFHDSNLLGNIIKESKSQCIVLGNIVGNMNESVLLPILRDRNTYSRRLVLLCEDIKDLEYLPRSYFNYLYFVQSEVTEACEDGVTSFSLSNDIILNAHKINYKANEKGYMIARALFKNTRIAPSYILTRGRFCCVLLENNYRTKRTVDILLKEVEIFCDSKDKEIITQNLQEQKILEYVEE